MTDEHIPQQDNSTAPRPDKNNFVYAARVQTSILLEQPSNVNPYVSKANYLYGYNVLELLDKKRLTEVLLLLFTGELPSMENARLLERLMIGLMNLGPRHPAVKAAMVAGVSKTNTEHLLPIGLSALGGSINGAAEVEQAMLFLQGHVHHSVDDVIEQLLSEYQQQTRDDNAGEYHLCPGFGNHYGSIDEYTADLAQQIVAPTNMATQFPVIAWAQALSAGLAAHQMGWLKAGLAAAVFCELGVSPRAAIGLFQLVCAPGIFAHGVEQTHKPITAIPMLADEQVQITR